MAFFPEQSIRASEKWKLERGKISRQDRIFPHETNPHFESWNSDITLTFQVSISCCEIYNENIIDLMVPQGRTEKALQVSQNNTTGFYVKGLTRTKCESLHGALKCIKTCMNNRHTRAHLMNDQSSRSHCLLTIYFESRERKPLGEISAHRRWLSHSFPQSHTPRF